ncbi:hypothetical protein Dip510_000661 [Elusimicrobium posterum]|uniref:hypothetical protein n=1 Tax=Elusimicrobium posterum TaxID=3116653 RepID=UPI003C75FF11
MKNLLSFSLVLCLFSTISYAGLFEDKIADAHIDIRVNGGAPLSLQDESMRRYYELPQSTCDGVIIARNWILTQKDCVPKSSGKKTENFFKDKMDFVDFVVIKNKGKESRARFSNSPAKPEVVSRYEANDFVLLDTSYWFLKDDFRAKYESGFIPQIMVFEDAKDMKKFLFPANGEIKVSTNSHSGSGAKGLKEYDSADNTCVIKGFSGVNPGGGMYVSHKGNPVLVLILKERNTTSKDRASFIDKETAAKISKIANKYHAARTLRFVNSKFQPVEFTENRTSGKVEMKVKENKNTSLKDFSKDPVKQITEGIKNYAAAAGITKK